MGASRPDLPDPDAPSLRRSLAVVLVSLVVVLASVPGVDYPLRFHTLDADWSFALHEIFAGGKRFGSDVVFTYGPWGFLLFRYGHEETAPFWFAGRLTLWASLALIWWRLANVLNGRVILRGLLCGFLLISAAAGIPDGLMYASMAVLPLTLLTGRRRSTAGDVLIAAGLAFLGWTKFPFLVAIVPALATHAWIEFSRERRVSRLCAAWILFAPMTWLLAGQRLVDLPSFLRWSALITRDYADSSGASLISWSASAGQAAALAAVITILVLRTSSAPGPRRVWLVSAIWAGACTLLAIKAAFVRHDAPHQSIAAGYVLYLTIASVLVAPPRRVRELMLVALGFVTAAMMGAFHTWGGGLGPADPERLVTFLRKAAAASGAHLSGTAGSREPRCELAALSTDSYSGGQSLVISSNAVYQPRPTIQSYVAYAPELANINRQHLAAFPPQRLLFRIQPIDGRVPHHDDGASWPLIWSRYVPLASRCDGFVQLRLAAAASRPADPKFAAGGDGRFGEWIPLPEPGAGELELRVFTVRSVPGRLATVAFRGPHLRLTLRLDDGSERSHRAVQRLLESGITVVPFIRTTEDFLTAGWGDRNSLRRVTAFRIDSEEVPFSGWRDEIEWAVFRAPGR